jgi:hypothetical protein
LGFLRHPSLRELQVFKALAPLVPRLDGKELEEIVIDAAPPLPALQVEHQDLVTMAGET